MALVTSALGHNASHPGLRRQHLGPNSNSSTWHLSSSSPQSSVIGDILVPSRTRCNRSLRSRAGRVSNEHPHHHHAHHHHHHQPSRNSFPPDFIFGAATSAYQVEGAWNKDGRGPSVWDHYCHTYPERIEDRSNGDVAVNSYYMYEEDVKMLKAMGMDAYRFSISWSRILPKGTIEGGINHAGIRYYKNLICKLKEYGIKPYVTIFHWDTPLALHEEYGSFLDRRFIKDYRDFAKVCFENFGDDVKHWFTFNEPYIYSCYAFGTGQHAPGRCSPGMDCAVPSGDSLTEPYRVGHHLLLAHAEAVDLYRKHFKDRQCGEIGIALVSNGYEPYDKMHIHEQAQARAIDHNLGWFLEPLARGDYPFSMRALVGGRLPYFTDEEQKKLVGAYDMLGLNYYTSMFAKHIDISPRFSPTKNTDDVYAELTAKGPHGDIGPNTGINWLYSYPEGLKNLLMIIKDRYGNPPVYITENGIADVDGGKLPMKDALNDTTRLTYLQDHIAVLKESIDMGSNVTGHFTWSLLDNFEWAGGYGPRFGLIYVDYKDNFKRHMKKSAKWFAEFNGVASGKEGPRRESVRVY